MAIFAAVLRVHSFLHALNDPSDELFALVHVMHDYLLVLIILQDFLCNIFYLRRQAAHLIVEGVPAISGPFMIAAHVIIVNLAAFFRRFAVNAHAFVVEVLIIVDWGRRDLEAILQLIALVTSQELTAVFTIPTVEQLTLDPKR